MVTNCIEDALNPYILPLDITQENQITWGILDREIYIGLWIVIFIMMGFYLLGKIKFSHDSDMPFLKVPRLLFAIATFSFVSYLVPGLFGAPLKALARI